MGYIAENLGSKIKKYRELNNLTQLKLAELINMESSNLSKIERGVQIPKEESLESIIKVLNINIKDLFDFDDKTTKEELLKEIVSVLENSSYKELELYNKIIKTIRESC